MAERASPSLIDFSGGEKSPLMAARTDDPGYAKSLTWCQNFIIQPQGPADYRTGNQLCATTNANATAYLMPWQFSALDAIVIEITDSTMRFYRNGGLILNSPVTISGVTQANPAVVTATAHGYSNGQQVYISGVWGMQQVNGRLYTVAGQTTNTFQLQDQFGNNVDSTTYTAWTANGTVASVYTLATPYLLPDLPLLRWAQTADVGYIVNQNYAPEKLVRSAFASWAINTFSRTNDPFTGGTTYAITGITRALPGVVTVASTTGLANGNVIQIYGLGSGSMKQLAGNNYIVANLTSTTFSLEDTAGNPLDTTRYHSYSSGGTVKLVNNFPRGVCFTPDGRLCYVNSRLNPMGLWASRLPGAGSGSGYTPGTQTNYDDFSTGATDDMAYAYQFSPINGEIDAILEVKPFGGMLSLLGNTAVQQAYGAQTGQPPNPTAIGELSTIQGAANVQPVAINQSLMFVDANQKKLRALQFNFYSSAFVPLDMNKDSEHFGKESPFIKLCHVKGVPEVIFVLRADGVLLSFTFTNTDSKDLVATAVDSYVGAWARHYVGGGGQVIDICSIRESSGYDRLYMTVQRTISAQVVNTVEVMSIPTQLPLRRTFWSGGSGDAAKYADDQLWANSCWEAAKGLCYLDMALNYNGTARGLAAGATMTPSATTGACITLTASAAVFQPADVGSQVWKNLGAGGAFTGQARITAYVNSTTVTADVLVNFDSLTPIAAGSWYFAVNQVVNLQLFAGQTINVQADGGAHPAVTVSATGVATLEYYVSVANFGFSYTGRLATQNLAFLTSSGPGTNKPRIVNRIRPRFDTSFGGKVGTSDYDLQEIYFRPAGQAAGTPAQPFTGVVDTVNWDQYDLGVKEVVVVQQDPTRCCVLGLDVEGYKSAPP
jgi:hypothetical protein